MQGIITRTVKEAYDINGFYIKLIGLDDISAEDISTENDTIKSDTRTADKAGNAGDSAYKPFSYIPGQYIMLAFTDDLDSKRAFSIVDYNPLTMEIFVLIKKHGPFTQRIFDSKIGQELEVFGPYGTFTLPKREDEKVESNGQSNEKSDKESSGHSPLVFIAGGIGITPIYSMILHAHNQHYDRDIHLFYSVKSLEYMPLSLCARLNRVNNGNIKVKYHFTSQNSDWDVGDNKKNERLDCNKIIREVPEFDNCTYYICGPGAMIEDFRQKLMDKGVPEENIKSEDFT
jgi:ferredoxin-NADP reductase